MKILVLGGNGMLGSQLVEDLKSLNDVYTIGRTKCINSKNHFEIDINNAQSLSFFLKENYFELVINSAAIIDHVECETNPEDCLRINALINKTLLDSTHHETKIIYISTDAVFSDKNKERLPSSCTSPQSLYGLSKDFAEKILLNSEEIRNFLIIRTTIVGFNFKKKGFIEWIVNSLMNNKEITLFEDVIFNPISIYNLSAKIQYILNREQIKRNIIHLNGTEAISKYKFGLSFAKETGLNHELIKKGTLGAFPDKGSRCYNQFLDVFNNELNNLQLPTVQETITELTHKFYDFNKI